VLANQASVLRCPAGVLEAWIGTRPADHDSREFWHSYRGLGAGWTQPHVRPLSIPRVRTASLVPRVGGPALRARRVPLTGPSATDDVSRLLLAFVARSRESAAGITETR
jgi:hypothetical protein